MPNPSELERQRQWAAEGEGEVVENTPIKTYEVNTEALQEMQRHVEAIRKAIRDITGIGLPGGPLER